MNEQRMLDQYTYRVTWSQEDDQCVGLCAEFPSLSWLANTPEKALRGIRKVVAEVVEDMHANKEPPAYFYRPLDPPDRTR